MTEGVTVRYGADAEADILDISLAIGRDSESAGRRFVLAVRSTASRIAEFPNAGAVVPFGDAEIRSCRWTCVRGFESWLIVYRVEVEGIRIVRVLHGARNLEVLEG